MNIQTDQPLVSVVIPTYNRPLFLRDAIASALNQTYKNIEILVSDDCSSISPIGVIESFQDARIRFWSNEKNLGMFRNTINAFRKANGKYVASLNDDDMWKEDFLEKLIPPLEADPELALAFCDHYVVDAKGTINPTATEDNTRCWKRDGLNKGTYQPFYQAGLVDQSVSTAAAAVIRKDAVDWDNMPDSAGVAWDLYTTYLACCSGRGAYYVPERLTLYREHEQSASTISGSAQGKMRWAQSGMFCYGTFMQDDRLKEHQSYFRSKWVEASTSMGIALLRLNNRSEARPYLLSALGQKFNLRTLVALALSFTPQPLSRPFIGVKTNH